MSNNETMKFPVDESTLMAVEHALGGVLEYNEDEDELYLAGADYSLPTLLEFLSGVSEDDYIEAYDEVLGEFYVTLDKPMFGLDDIIQALMSEVRRLRELVPEEQREIS